MRYLIVFLIMITGLFAQRRPGSQVGSGYTNAYTKIQTRFVVRDSLSAYIYKESRSVNFVVEGDLTMSPSPSAASVATAWASVYAAADDSTTIKFPEGVYDFSTASLTINKSLNLVGVPGKTIFLGPNDRTSTVNFEFQSSAIIDGIVFDQWTRGIEWNNGGTIDSADHFIIRNCEFRNGYKQQIYAQESTDGSAYIKTIRFENNYIHDSEQGMFFQVDYSNAFATNNIIKAIHDDVAEAAIDDDTVYGINIGPNVSLGTYTQADLNGIAVVSHNQMDSLYSDDIVDNGASVTGILVYGDIATISDNVMKNFYAAQDSNNQFMNPRVNSWRITNNVMEEINAGHVANLKGSVGLHNIFEGNSYYGTGSQPDVLINSTGGITFRGNTIRVNNTNAIQDIALFDPETQTTEIIIEDNTLIANSSYGISYRVDGAQTYAGIKNNYISTSGSPFKMFRTGSETLETMVMVGNTFVADSAHQVEIRYISKNFIARDNISIITAQSGGTHLEVFNTTTGSVDISDWKFNIQQSTTAISIMNLVGTGSLSITDCEFYVAGNVDRVISLQDTIASAEIVGNKFYGDTLMSDTDIWFTRLDGATITKDLFLTDNTIVSSDSIKVQYGFRVTPAVGEDIYFLRNTFNSKTTDATFTWSGTVGGDVYSRWNIYNNTGVQYSNNMAISGSEIIGTEGTEIASTGEAGGTKFLREDGDGTSSWQAIGGGGDALVANPLSQFAATTSAQLRGVLTDESGTGVFLTANGDGSSLTGITGGDTTFVEQAGVAVGDTVKPTLNFQSGFTVTESPLGQFNITATASGGGAGLMYYGSMMFADSNVTITATGGGAFDPVTNATNTLFTTKNSTARFTVQGDSIIVDSAGVYDVSGYISYSAGAVSDYTFAVLVNGSAVTTGLNVDRGMSGTDDGVAAVSGHYTFSAGDRVKLGLAETAGTVDPTVNGAGLKIFSTGLTTATNTDSLGGFPAADYAKLASPTFTGTVVLPSGQALIAPALGTPASGVMTNVTGTAAGLTAGTATVATTVTITDNESTAENNPIVFVAGADPDGGNLGLESDGTTHYNPSTGTITATQFSGGGAGLTGVTVPTADISDVSVSQTELAELETIGSTVISDVNWIAVSNLTGVNSGDGSITDSSFVTITFDTAHALSGNKITFAATDTLETLGFLAGLDSLLNVAIDADQNTITNIENADIKAGAAIDATKLADGTVTSTELQYINTLSSNAQTQLNAKEGTLTNEAGLYSALSDVTNFLQTGDAIAGDDITDGSVDGSEIDESSLVMTNLIDSDDYVDGSIDIEHLADATSGVVTKNTATNYTVGTTDSRESYGGIIYVTGAATITLPAVAAKMAVTIITVGAVAVSVDCNASDLMYLDGTALDDGDKATNTSTTGDLIVLTYYDATGWYAASGSNDGDLWTDGGP